jgi:antitoxin component YwqK of YwqJK toxin-antitoxin module
MYKEYYTNGKIKMEGSIINGKSDSLWRYYYENGALKGEGLEKDGLKTGKWTFYHENGAVLSEGTYAHGTTNGIWKYYHPNGTISSEGEEKEGEKEGYWKLYYENATLKGEATYLNGNGEYKEYYESGKLKAVGNIKNGKNEGKWLYYYENGAIEAEVNFVAGEGEYVGFYETGQLKMEGTIKDNKKIGVWKLYDESGNLAGYYKTFYENKIPQFEKLPDNANGRDSMVVYEKPDIKLKKKKSRYFTAKHNEFTGIIVSTNPAAPILGSLPIYVEYYIQERLGFSFIYTLKRDPFFIANNKMDLNTPFERGFSTAVRMKFYKPDENLGMFYFANELRFSSSNHLANVKDSMNSNALYEIKARENKIEYSFLMGNRFMKYANKSGFSLDAFLGLGIGYRDYKEKFPDKEEYKDVFRNINKSSISIPLRIGFSIGYAF